MMRSTLIAALLIGTTLLGCQRDLPPKTAGEVALANLAIHVKPLNMNDSRYRAVVCDNGGSTEPMLICHADLLQTRDGDEKKVDSVAFSCSTEPDGRCVHMSVSDAAAAAASQAGAAPICADALHPQLTVDVPDAGAMTVSDYTARDTVGEGWVNASFTLQDTGVRLSEAQVRSALDHLSGRIAAICRSYPLKKTRIFLYPAGVTAGESANWIARFEDFGSRNIDFNRALLKDERVDRYTCLDEKEPGIGGNDGTKLPPVRQREIIGTWVGMNPRITMSLERVKGKVYRVYRSAYCASGERGELLQTGSKGRYIVIDSRAGDYYQVTPIGDLGVFDRTGSIDVMPQHFALHPATTAE
jgi:hypothetical protein